MSRFPVIQLEGTPYDRGLQYGNQASEQIRRNIDIYFDLFAFHANLNKAEVFEIAELYTEIIATEYPEIYEEINGIAEGSNTKLLEIVSINSRMELLATSPNRNSECTDFAILPRATQNNIMLLGQNWDWFNVTNGLSLLLRIKQYNKPTIITLVEAGHVAKMGLNSHGIGLCVSWLGTGIRQTGIPFIIICRKILESNHISEALNIVLTASRGTSANYMIASSDGFAIDIETTVSDVDFIEPKEGILVHTNHYLSPKLKPFDTGIKKRNGDSLFRKQRTENLLEQALGRITLETVESIQKDTIGSPYSICTSPAAEEHRLAQWNTMSGIIMDLSNMIMYLTNGNPRKNNSYEVTCS